MLKTRQGPPRLDYDRVTATRHPISVRGGRRKSGDGAPHHHLRLSWCREIYPRSVRLVPPPLRRRSSLLTPGQRRILTERHGYRIAVIMNEFGDTAVCVYPALIAGASAESDLRGTGYRRCVLTFLTSVRDIQCVSLSPSASTPFPHNLSKDYQRLFSR